MLTKQDLNAIGDLIETKLEEKLESKLEEKLESKFTEKLNPIYKELKTIKKDIKNLKKVVEKDFDFHDRHSLQIVENVQAIQKHLNIPVMNYA